MELWPHQEHGVNATLSAIQCGLRRILLTSPTGMGKTLIARTLLAHYLDRGAKASMYSNRRLLIDQLSATLTAAGFEHGVRAAGYADERDFPLQISSIQTELERVNTGKWGLHASDIVIVDEAHMQKSPGALALLTKHWEAGAAVVGITATPLDIPAFYEDLIVAGSVSEGRKCGALVAASHYGPDEPDYKAAAKELSENEQRKIMGRVKEGEADVKLLCLFGRVVEWFKKLNPTNKPAILFAPGVEESVWFAKEFSRAGIPAGHIDGETVWIDGELYRSNKLARDKLLEASRTGKVKVICNRFVLREGIDAPWLSHGVFATVFGSLQTYLQSGGRLLRNDGTGQGVTIQDHGGNWWRYGSLNADREWNLGDCDSVLTSLRFDRMRQKKCKNCKAELLAGPLCRCGTLNAKEPVVCPECKQILVMGKCPCGYVTQPKFKSRSVVQSDGQLVERKGDIFKPRRISKATNAAAKWERVYWRCRNARKPMTFLQAEVLFAKENRWAWPARDLPLMPLSDYDLHRHIAEVPMERLRRKSQ